MAEVIKEKQDLTYLDWTRTRNSSGTAGSFLKAYSNLGERKTYYKLSNYDSVRGIVGHECINEIIVDRLLTILGVPHLSYRLIHADILLDGKVTETWLCASEDFKAKGESKIALDIFYEAEKEDGESPLEFCIRNGFGTEIYEMLAVDYLILNRDRHGANIEVLRNREKKTVRLAPLFDHGLSLLFQCRTEEEWQNADGMEDKPVQSFVGGRSAVENLRLIPKDAKPELRPFVESDVDALLDGLDAALPEKRLQAIGKMIYERWNHYESFFNQR